MGMHDLFGVVDDPVTEAARMLAQHDLFVVPGSVLRECLNVLHILVCDCESAEEAMLTQALIHHIESAWEQATGLKVGAHDTAAMLPNARSEARPACGTSRSTEELYSMTETENNND